MAISEETIKSISTAIDSIIDEDEKIQNRIAKENAKEDRHEKRELSGKLYQLLDNNQSGSKGGEKLKKAMENEKRTKIASKKLIENLNGSNIILINHGVDKETNLPIQRVIELPVYKKLVKVKGIFHRTKKFINDLKWTDNIKLAINPSKISPNSTKSLTIDEKDLGSLSKKVKQKWKNVEIEE